MSSDECFARNGRDAGSWITQVYQITLNRRPTQRDLMAWIARLNALRGDRLSWAREFLRAADWQAPVFNRPPAVVVGTGGNLPTRLVTTCQLLSQSVQSELPGNRGWLAYTQANNLLTAAEANRFILANPANNPAAFSQAMTSLQTNLDALRSTLAQAGVTAPSSRLYADQVYQLLISIQDSVPTPLWVPPPTRPIPPPVVNPGCIDQIIVDQYLRRLDEIHVLVIRFESSLKNTIPRDWTVDRLLRDAEDFHASLDRFRVQVRVGARHADLRLTLAGMRQQADRISAQIRQGRFDRLTVQAWYDIGTAFNRLVEHAGIANTDVVTRPGYPVPYETGGGFLPIDLDNPAYQPPPVQQDFTSRSIDEAVAQCDSLSTALTPYSFQSPVVLSLQGELRTLRNSLLDLRRNLTQNAPQAQLSQSYRAVSEDAIRVESLWGRVQNSVGVGGDLPDVVQLRRALQQINSSALSPSPFQP
jgi:hypothetical protein